MLLYLTCRGRKQFVFWLDLSIGHYPLFTKLVSGFLSFLRVHLQVEVIFWKSGCLVLLKIEVRYGLCKPKNYDSNLFVTILMGLNLNFEIFYSNFDFSSPISEGDYCHFPTFSRHAAVVIIFPTLLLFLQLHNIRELCEHSRDK